MPNKSKPKLTVLQQEILEFFLAHPTTVFHGRELARALDVSAPAIAKALPELQEQEFISVKKDIVLSIKLNRDNEQVFSLKRVANLKALYESDVLTLLSKEFPGTCIVLFGSYAFGEDIESSDIDLAIIGAKEKELDLSKFEKELNHTINLDFFPALKSIPKNLQVSIINGIVLKGALHEEL